MLPNNHLQIFAQQLVSWAEQIIENGRTPFRRVDLFHKLNTSSGLCHPPLIFWINRQSMIAGGLLFLPDSTTDSAYVNEAAAADSLGLRHFVTWEAEAINVWETTPAGNVLVSSLPLTKTQDPAVFHHRLYDLIDQLKLLSVTGRISAEQISPYYLLNLLEETLTLSFPTLLEACRLRLSDESSTFSADDEAHSWNRLTLLRLLSLLYWDVLPANQSIEQLTTASEQLLRALPEPLGQGLLALTPESTCSLPAETSVAFHHLLLRLQQINWQSQGPRQEKTLRLLLNLWYGDTACNDLPNAKDRLLLHSQELAPYCYREISRSGAQLAANTLIRILDKRSHPKQVQGDAFKADSTLEEGFLHANFQGSQRPSLDLRREVAGHLRKSWPNRRHIIPGNLPFWATEAAHLLGLTKQGGQVELHLPANWLRLLNGSFFSELLFSNFVLLTVDCRDNNRHLLSLCRQQEESTTECLFSEIYKRSLELGRDHQLAANRLLCALELPPHLFELFIDQQLVFLTDTCEELSQQQGLVCYSQSSLGQQLWEMCSKNPIPETAEKIFTDGVAINWLIPEASCLKELSQRVNINGKAMNRVQRDEHLNQLLGLPTDVPDIQSQTSATVNPESQAISRNLSDELLRQLEIDGIPHFPQTYLYRQTTGPLCQYLFAPPLTLSQELLDQYELTDDKGQQIQVTGEETKDALLLASILGMTSLEIPVDRLETAKMLDSYRLDLHNLQKNIARLCLLNVEQSAASQRLQKKLWNQLNLPPLKWLNS